MKYIAGIDVGTSGVKCILIDQNAQVAAVATEGYPLYTPHDGWSEQDPADWWKGTVKALKQVIHAADVDSDDIVGVGLSGQMHGLVPLDEQDQVIRHAILWNDQRTQRECDEIISNAGGLDALLEHTNNHMLTGFTGGKIQWMKNHEPDLYDRIDQFLLPKDYIRFLLTGEKSTDTSDASGTGLFNVQDRTWDFDFIERLGLKPSMFVPCRESDEVTGYVTASAAQLTGLKAGTPVFAGGGDAVIQSTGMGIVEEGTVGLIIGTSGIVAMSLDGYGHNDGGRLQFFCNNSADKWSAFGCQLSSGGSLEWFKEQFYDMPDPFTQINREVRASEPGAHGVVFLPYLTGERCPYPDPHARGVFYGLALNSNRGDMARAVMEGVTYGLRQIYQLICEAKPDMKPQAIISSGGGSKSAVWRQIQADIFNLPVKTLTGAAEGGAYGAAIVAGVGAGWWADIEAAAKLLKEETITYPIAENVPIYEKYYEIYSGLYHDLKDRFQTSM